jgi:hypothetical protein
MIEPVISAGRRDVPATDEGGLGTGRAALETIEPEWAERDAGHRPENQVVEAAGIGHQVVGWRP